MSLRLGALVEGRNFDSQDTTDKANVIVVDAALVNHFFPGQNPIGKSISIGGGGNFRSAPSVPSLNSL